MVDDRDEVAVDTVARRLIAHAWRVREHALTGPVRDDYPDLTDFQWAEVIARADRLVDGLDTHSEDELVAAYEYLTGHTP